MQKLYEEGALEPVLWLLHDAWGDPEDPEMLSAYIIGGLGGFVMSAQQSGKWNDQLYDRLLAKMKQSSPKRMKTAIADRCQGSGYNRARAGVTEFSVPLAERQEESASLVSTFLLVDGSGSSLLPGPFLFPYP